MGPVIIAVLLGVYLLLTVWVADRAFSIFGAFAGFTVLIASGAGLAALIQFGGV